MVFGSYFNRFGILKHQYTSRINPFQLWCLCLILLHMFCQHFIMEYCIFLCEWYWSVIFSLCGMFVLNFSFVITNIKVPMTIGGSSLGLCFLRKNIGIIYSSNI